MFPRFYSAIKLLFLLSNVHLQQEAIKLVNQAAETLLSELQPCQIVQPYELAGGFHSAPIGLPNVVLHLSSFVWTELVVYRLFVFSHTPIPNNKYKTVPAEAVPFEGGRAFPKVMAHKNH